MTAAAAGLFAQHLRYIYPGRGAPPGCLLRSITCAGSAGEYRRRGQGASFSLLALESTFIFHALHSFRYPSMVTLQELGWLWVAEEKIIHLP